MREIKFRIYGTINCFYLTIDGWKPKDLMCEVSSLNIKTNKCRVLYKGEKNTNEYDTLELSKCNLMQFTGLKDKNGKDIYEGDILLYLDAKGVVYYQNDICMFMVNFKNNHSNWSFDSMDEELEIIGNIYEN